MGKKKPTIKNKIRHSSFPACNAFSIPASNASRSDAGWVDASGVIRNSYYSGGYIALTSILVISAVALAISISISLLGVGEAKSSFDYKKGQETLKIAESCIEEALLRLRNDSNYAGASLNVGNGTCSINVSGADADRTIDVSAQLTNLSSYTQNIQVTAKRTGNSINIVSWNQVE